MSNTPSKAEIESLVKRHGATSYRNRADTQHPAYGFTEDGLNGLIDEVLAKWPAPQQEAQEPSHRETVDVVGVRSNGEHVNLEKIVMSPRMKARGIAIEQFGSFKDDDGSDADMCFGALESFLEWLIQQGWSKAPQPAPAPLSERDAFEAAWEKLHGKRPVLLSRVFAEHKMETPSHSEGKYLTRDEQAAWKLWQARAALAAQGGKDA